MFDVIVVAYNVAVAEIPVIGIACSSSLVERVIVCDNSDDDSFEASGRIPEKVEYLSMGGNAGLSRAYNCALERCEADYVCIADDDTEFPEDYFTAVTTYIAQSSAEILLPVVRTESGMLSPCKRGRYRLSRIADLDNMPNSFSAINSGMVVQRSVYSLIRYDERLFVDMVDHRFMDQVREIGFIVEVMHDVVLFQDFSRERGSTSISPKRYALSARDNRIYYSNTLLERLFCELQLLHLRMLGGC